MSIINYVAKVRFCHNSNNFNPRGAVTRLDVNEIKRFLKWLTDFIYFVYILIRKVDVFLWKNVDKCRIWTSITFAISSTILICEESPLSVHCIFTKHLDFLTTWKSLNKKFTYKSN